MITIIIPSYKNKELLQIAIVSVLKQEFQNYELVVVDDTPSNEIEEYCESLQDNHIRYYHNKPSKGAVDNWNYGLSLAEGDKIILLHHDESFCCSDFLARLDEQLNRNDVVISNKKVLLETGEKKEPFPKWIKPIVIKLNYLLYIINVIGPCACVAFRRDMLVEFDNRLQWKVDIEWYFRILRKAKRLKYLPSQEITSHHGHKDQITGTININEVNAIDTAIIKKKYNSTIIDIVLFISNLVGTIHSRRTKNN